MELRKYLLLYLEEGIKLRKELELILKDYLPSNYLIKDFLGRVKIPHYIVTLGGAGDEKERLKVLQGVINDILKHKRGWKGLKIALVEVKEWIEIEDWGKAKKVTFNEKGEEIVEKFE